jgi:hypothetical protein
MVALAMANISLFKVCTSVKRTALVAVAVRDHEGWPLMALRFLQSAERLLRRRTHCDLRHVHVVGAYRHQPEMISGPMLREREVTGESLDGMNADRTVHDAPVAGVLTRVIADASFDSRQRIVAKNQFPRGARVGNDRARKTLSSVASGFSRKDVCGVRFVRRFSASPIRPPKGGSHPTHHEACLAEARSTKAGIFPRRLEGLPGE